MATSRSVPSVRRASSDPANDIGESAGTKHVAPFACSTSHWFALLFRGIVFRGRFRRSVKRSMVGQVHARFEATQLVHFGRCSSHFFLRCRHVRQPVFVRKDACEVGNGFIVGRKGCALAQVGSVWYRAHARCTQSTQ